jgi:hypothetical protein
VIAMRTSRLFDTDVRGLCAACQQAPEPNVDSF